MKIVLMAVIMVMATTAQAHQGNIWLALNERAPEQTAAPGGEAWDMSGYPWLDGPTHKDAPQWSPVLEVSGYTWNNVNRELEVAGGNIWTGGCLRRFSRWLSNQAFGDRYIS